MIDEDDLIEHAMVYGDYKGIPKKQVREALTSGMDVVMRIDVQGAETVRRLAPEALMIFITTENEAGSGTPPGDAQDRNRQLARTPDRDSTQGAQARGSL